MGWLDQTFSNGFVLVGTIVLLCAVAAQIGAVRRSRRRGPRGLTDAEERALFHWR